LDEERRRPSARRRDPNIAINACYAIPDGGKLKIETGNAYLDEAYRKQTAEVESGQFVMVAVSDTGTGMEPVFHHEAGRQRHRPRIEPCLRLQKQSRGYIKIYSEIGAGTTAIDGRGRSDRHVAAAPIRTGNTTEIIVVVEDESLMGQMSTEALRDLGYAVIESATR
jgi:hypothetical protein